MRFSAMMIFGWRSRGIVWFCALASALLIVAGGGQNVFAEDRLPVRCTKCHTEKVMLDRVAKIPPVERDSRLDLFLTKHFVPKAAERKAIISVLMAGAEKR